MSFLALSFKKYKYILNLWPNSTLTLILIPTPHKCPYRDKVSTSTATPETHTYSHLSLVLTTVTSIWQNQSSVCDDLVPVTSIVSSFLLSVSVSDSVPMVIYPLPQAVDSRDSVAMALYSQCFSWIIMRINQKIKGKDNFKSIGILDIFGFENFEVKSYSLNCPWQGLPLPPGASRVSSRVSREPVSLKPNPYVCFWRIYYVSRCGN